MPKRKRIHERGKIKFSRAFQNLEKDDIVSISREIAMQPRFPRRMQGKTGIVKEKRGRAFVIKINDGKSKKELIINPIHLKKLK